MLLIVRVYFNLTIPREPSMKDICSNPHVLSIMTSMIERGNSPLRHASFRSQKSMQTRIFPFFLVTGTILATQLGCCSSLIKSEFISFLTSDWIAFILGRTVVLLLDGLHLRIDVEAMHSHLRIKSRHILIIPSENIYILSHKRY